MRVFIGANIENEFDTINMAAAYYGFMNRGWEIIKFKENSLPQGLSREDVVVGKIDDVKIALKNLGCIPPKELDYPEDLKDLYGRKIWREKLHNIANDESTWPVFIKPYNGKQFTGRLITSIKDLIGCGSQQVVDIWCSSPVKFVAEWRCFVCYGKVMDVRHYKGTWEKHFDPSVLKYALELYKNQPASFTVDIGLTEKGETLIVEVNDGYSVGTYGLQPHLYCKFLSARWSEMVNIPDPCRF